MRRRKREEKPKLFSTRNMVAFFIVFIMTTSIAGFLINSNSTSEKLEYNGFEFSRVGNYYMTKVEGKRIYFTYPPENLAQMEIPPEAGEAIRNTKMLYVAYNESQPFVKDYALLQYNINDVLKNHLNTYVVNALLNKNEYGLPVVSCKNATQTVPVIIFKESNSSSITYDNGCITLNGEFRQDFYALTERLLYSVFGIIP